MPPAGNWVRFSGSIWHLFVLSHNMPMTNTTGKIGFVLALFYHRQLPLFPLSGHWSLSVFTRHRPLATLVVRRIPDDTPEILFHALTQCQRWHRLASFTFMAATPVHLAQANHHVALANCHSLYPTPSSATRNWVRFACMIPYEMLRFPGFLKISAGIVFVASQCSTTTCIHIALDSRGQHS